MVNQQNHNETTHENTEHESTVQDRAADLNAEHETRTAAPQLEAERSEQTTPSESATAEAEPDHTSDPETQSEGDDASEPLVLPFDKLSATERFQATTRLIFLAPDVPPIQPRPRNTELRHLDELLDERFAHDADSRESTSNRRRNRRRSGNDSNGTDDEGSRRSQRQAPAITEPQKVKGSTRLEAKKQRRRDGREAGRRRTVITESEFLARREAVDREMIVRTAAGRIQIGVLEDRVLVEHYVARSSESSMIGNVYLGRVQNVLPSMEAAFVDIGRGRNAVLYSGEVDWSEFEGSSSARRIENALKPGDQVLVQVTKDPVGHKGARLTSQISLPGRFLVYVPGGAMNGISRKLPDTERARLKKILKQVLPSGAGVIVRTAAEGASEDQLTHDVERLTRQWESIRSRTESGGAPVLLHSEPDMLIKIVRDVFNEDFHKLVISGEETYSTIQGYLSQVAPDLLERVERHSGDRDVFDEYRISEQIAKALDRKVWLPSGGSLVIDRTEAMTVIDVNTGKFVGSGGNLEETVTKNNLEAAEEIVRQLRLRDIGGIIVVDFIDMVLESNRDLVLRRLVECLSRDRTKHQVAEVTSLGLVQMTRKKLGLGLLESFSEACETCAGRGIIVHHEPIAKHGGGGSRGRRKGASQQQQPSTQAHAISDGAKNMLAQVAASTIGGSKVDEAGEAAAPAKPAESERTAAGEPNATPQAAEPTLKESRTETSAQSSRRPEGNAQQNGAAPAGDPAALLDSVLEALPDAPAVGRGRSRGRRVTAPTSSTATAQSSAASVGSENEESSTSSSTQDAVDAEQARLALDAALDATAKQKNAD